jgi:type I restriction enzyme, S subunit
MTRDTFFANFGFLADAPNGVKTLRELILQLAVQGKLVAQDPNDEPASVLLEKIKAEKERIVKEKKIKKAAPLTPVSPNEAPYELPKGWEWTRLVEIGQIIGGGTPSSSNPEFFAHKGIPWLTPADLYGIRSKYISRGKRDLTELGLRKSSAQLMPKGTILFSSRAPIGYVAIAQNQVSTNQGFKSCVPFMLEMNEYIYWFLKCVAEEIDWKAPGTTFKEVSGKIFGNVKISVPPFAEQHRIVAKVDQLMKLCDELEKRQQKKNQKLVNLNNAALDRLLTARKLDDLTKAWHLIRDSFDFLYTTQETITKLRQSILQLAVQGKLVRQDPSDESASVLLAKIKAEKERLVKEKKIKKTPSLPPVSSDDIPYELPQGWLWVRLSMLGITQTGTTPSTANPEFFGSDYPFIKPADISDKGVRYNINKGLSRKGIEKGRLIEAFSVLMVCIGGSISKVNYIDRDCSCNQQINTITPFKGVDYRSLTYFMASPFFKEQVIENAPSTTLPILSKGKWEALPIPLPPEIEQHRILTKMDQLMKLCDELEAKLIKSQTKSEKLVEAAVKAVASG